MSDLERARAIAVALEQENADLRRQLDEATETVVRLALILGEEPVSEADAEQALGALRASYRRGYAAGLKARP